MDFTVYLQNLLDLLHNGNNLNKSYKKLVSKENILVFII